jgi:tripartite-type tricarboxylate transporter receptor subunit TctC
MPKSTLRTVVIVSTIIASLGFAFAVTSYPNRVIRIIVPFPAGGLNDNVARIIQPPLQEELGQPIIIENRTSHTVTPVTNAKLPYDTERDFAPISILVRDPFLFVVSNSVPAKTLPEFIAFAKLQPAKINYATPGTASQSHLVTELLSQRAGIKMLEVPYRGGAPAVLALISGEVQFAVLSTQLSTPQIKGGKIRAIASGGRTRDEHFPDLPTLSESGFPDMEALQWVGMLAPAGTPKDVILHINSALQKIMSKPDIVTKLAAQGVSAAASSPEEFQTLISTEIREWREVAQRAALSPR